MSRPDVASMTVAQLATRRVEAPPALQPLVLDVREDWEREIAALPDTVDIPMNEIPGQLQALREQQGDRDLVVLCHSGQRSLLIARFLQQNGFERVINLSGGIDAWSQQIDESVHLY